MKYELGTDGDIGPGVEYYIESDDLVDCRKCKNYANYSDCRDFANKTIGAAGRIVADSINNVDNAARKIRTPLFAERKRTT